MTMVKAATICLILVLCRLDIPGQNVFDDSTNE